jgi:hypothetical protein
MVCAIIRVKMLGCGRAQIDQMDTSFESCFYSAGVAGGNNLCMARADTEHQQQRRSGFS